MPGSGIDAWDKLGGFIGGSAKVVKCETNNLLIPAIAEIVLEGRVITSEAMIHDEGPYGEFPENYGAGLPRNWKVEIDCITYRKGAIYQHATIGGLHPGKTDMYAFQQAIEGELFAQLERVGLLVMDVVAPADCGGNVATRRLRYARAEMLCRHWGSRSRDAANICPRLPRCLMKTSTFTTTHA